MARPTNAGRRSPSARSTGDDRVAQEQIVLDGFRRIVRELRLAASEASRTANVTAAQVFVLTQLVDSAAQSLSDLGRRTMTDRSSVAAIVERLVERKLVAVGDDPTDRRRTMIAITAKGRDALKRAPSPPTARLLAGLAAMSGGEVATLSKTITRLVEAMGLGASPAPMLFGDDDGKAG